ncbi:50S ribosomal protein L24 [Patescibacteria group bacterium]|nr:50S ribosomal protein L24 [Patescibacteria group bacterium]
MKIKKNDTVLIISGKDKGKKGKVLQALPRLNKILVEGVNKIKKHKKARKEREKGQVVEISKPINVSDAKLVCPKCGKAVRIGYRLTEKGKYRICKKCSQEI